MPEVIVYTFPNCPYCVAAKKLLSDLNVNYQEIDVKADETLREKIFQLTGKRTVPQIMINGKPIGGFDNLSALHQAGTLQQLLNTQE